MVSIARRLIPHCGWFWAVGFCATCKQAADRGAEVKPYTWDFLFTLLIVLAAHRCLVCEASRRHLWPLVCLLALALLAPWCSLPSVFVLGGASMALLCQAVRSRSRRQWCSWTVFNLLGLASAASLYYLVLRHQRTTALDDYWKGFYGDASSPARLLAWSAACLIKIGQYGSNGLGVPLLLFAVAGGILLGWRAPAQLVLLAGPLALGMTASLLRCYPLEDRLTFFLVPCLYLLAAEGLGALAEAIGSARCPRWLAGVSLASLTVLLLPGAGPTAKMAVFAPEPGFREAFAYVLQQRNCRDLFWVSHPQVFEAYFRGDETCLGSYDADEDVVRRARGRRFWLISTCPHPEQLERRLRAAGLVLTDAYRARGHVALLYTPPTP